MGAVRRSPEKVSENSGAFWKICPGEWVFQRAEFVGSRRYGYEKSESKNRPAVIGESCRNGRTF